VGSINTSRRKNKICRAFGSVVNPAEKGVELKKTKETNEGKNEKKNKQLSVVLRSTGSKQKARKLVGLGTSLPEGGRT